MDTNKLPDTITQTLYIVLPPYSEKPMILTSDMAEYGYAVLGTEEITLAVPQIDPRAQFIDALEKKAESIKAETQVKLNRISDEIRRLQALEHDGGEG